MGKWGNGLLLAPHCTTSNRTLQRIQIFRKVSRTLGRETRMSHPDLAGWRAVSKDAHHSLQAARTRQNGSSRRHRPQLNESEKPSCENPKMIRAAESPILTKVLQMWNCP